MNLRRKRIIGFRKLIALLVIAMLVVGGLILYFPNSFLDQRATEKLTEYLVEQLGPEAVVADVDLGWSQAVIRSVHLPLGKSGSMLEIERIEFDVDPLALLSQPEHYARVIKGVTIVDPRLSLRFSKSDSTVATLDSTETDKRIKVPDQLFAVLSTLDSLHRLEILQGSVSVFGGDSSTVLARGINGMIRQSGEDQLSLALNGYYLYSHLNRLELTGEIQPNRQLLQLTARITVPPGDFALALHDSLSFMSAGGEILLNAWSADQILNYNGSLSVEDIEVGYRSYRALIPSLQADLSEQGIDIVAPEVASDWFEADLYGMINLREQASFYLRGNISIDSLANVSETLKPGVSLRGAVDGSFLVQGELDEPVAFVTVQSDSITVEGVRLDAIAASVRTDFDSVYLDRLDLNHQSVSLAGTGKMILDSTRQIEISNTIKFEHAPSIAGLRSRIQVLKLKIDGSLSHPGIEISAIDSTGYTFGAGLVTLPTSADSGEWEIRVSSPLSDRQGQAYVRKSNGEWSVNTLGADVLLSILFPQADSLLSSVDELYGEFTGDDNGGSILIQMLVEPDAEGVLPELASQLEFSGSYSKFDSAAYHIDGGWSGVTGSGKPFFGQGTLIVENGQIEFRNFFIDEAGAISGSIDLQRKQLDVGLSVDELPFDSFPIQPAFFSRTKLNGKLSGETRLSGSFDSIQWTSNLTLIDGTIFDVPGYWCNLDAFGSRLRADSVFLSFGRGIRKILDAKGMFDFEQDTIYVKAVSGSASSNDFFLALTGINKIITGDLDGECTITGRVTSPDVQTEITIQEGELLGELFVDKFLLRSEFGHDTEGNRVFRIPTLAFGKLDEYRFFGEMWADMRAGGKLDGHFEGSGDFLDLLDQIDGTFFSHGSECQLTINLGGTYDDPQFVSGSLRIPDGKFAYPSASPSELMLDADIHVAAPGVVDRGYIAFKDGDRYLKISFLQEYQDEYYDLKPLVIPSPRLDLGILEFTTNDEGIPIRLPGFMELNWLGTFSCHGGDYNAVTISAEDSSSLFISGGVTIENARFTFPFVSSGSGRVLPVTEWLLARLFEAQWDLEVDLGSGNHYDVEITGFKDSDLSAKLGDQPFIEVLADYLDHLTVDAIVEPTEEPLLIRETLEDSTFYLLGRLSSNRGRVDYLDQTFSIDYVIADFDETNIMPVLEGRAETYGIDSLGRSVPVYLTIFEIDVENDTRYKQGRFDKVTYVLESDNADSPEAVLQLLGYGASNTSATAKAEQVLTRTALSAAKRRWLDPLARQLERTTIFDEIALTPGGGGRSERLFRQQREQALNDTTESVGVVKLFTGSHVTVGKYLTDDIFLSYTGELVEGPGDLEGSRLGLVHFWNLELRMDPLTKDLVLDFAVEYDEIERRRDESVALKYSFTLEP